MTITALPTVPQRSDSSTFATRREPFIEALGTFRTELNSTASVLNPLADPSTTNAATAVQGASTAVPNSTLAVTSKDAAVASSNAALASANAAKASESSAKDSSVVATTAASDALIAANATANVVNKVSTIRPSTRPSLNLDFSNTETLDPRITFVRNSISSYIDYDGLLKYAPAGKPCFAYDPVTGESLGLQIFESRTNLLTYSEQFDNAAWTKSNVTVTSNSTTAPDGTLTADKLVENTANAEHYVDGLYTVTSGTIYVYSVYAKAGEKSVIRLRVALGFSDTSTYFDLSTGVVQGTSANTYSGIQSIGGGWYRCWIGQAATSSASSIFRIQMSPAIYTGDGTSGIYIWGAQLEAGSFPTPYIPTTSSATTRAADQVSISGVNFSSWYNQGEGTLYAEGFTITPSTGNNNIIFDIGSGGAFGTSVYLARSPYSYDLAPNTAPINVGIAYTAASAVTTFRLSVSLKQNNTTYVFSGAIAGTDNSCNIPYSASILNIGKAGWTNGNFLNGYIKKLSYYPKRLSPTELVALTS